MNATYNAWQSSWVTGFDDFAPPSGSILVGCDPRPRWPFLPLEFIFFSLDALSANCLGPITLGDQNACRGRHVLINEPSTRMQPRPRIALRFFSHKARLSLVCKKFSCTRDCQASSRDSGATALREVLSQTAHVGIDDRIRPSAH